MRQQVPRNGKHTRHHSFLYTPGVNEAGTLPDLPLIEPVATFGSHQLEPG